ncbi:TolC family protein [Sediminibacterium roseum]|uniref:TolC family protein n=1 Tax=Sediminibacterium roseum TaxID=1978412 RepID=A0ABW9ZUB1_9BACT|nr:TolC family protein [Sediminibacterium roseum]NCI48803.1 TolC family protein [Sediminibacterium roseum]
MRKFLTFLCCALVSQAFAQRSSDNWDLRHCIEHAIEFNITVKQADIQARIAALQAKQAKYNVYPYAEGSSSTGVRFGRSIDPTTNTFATSQFLYQNFGVNAGFQVYNYGRLKNAQQVAQFNAQAALADAARAANDVSFNVATYYLQVLAAKEQTKIAEVQIAQTQNQYNITRKRVDAGALPELNIAEMEAQLAADSSNYYTAKGNYEQTLLALRALLNLDVDVLFGIETPKIDSIPIEPLSELEPALVYDLALQFQPLQKANAFRIKAAEKNILVTKAQMYPTITLGGNLSTNFSNSFKKASGIPTIVGYSPITGYEPIVVMNNVNYYIQDPVYKISQRSRTFGELWEGYTNQLSNNFGQNIGINISVPIFNAFSAKTNYAVSKLQLKLAQLTKDQGDLTLRQDIYTAYSNAVTALQKFNAGKKTVESAEKAYMYATKRFEVGLLSSLDLITNQNNLLRAKITQLNAQYDYVFKMKLLEFYKGQGLKY